MTAEAARKTDPISHVVTTGWGKFGEAAGTVAGSLLGALAGAAALVSPATFTITLLTTGFTKSIFALGRLGGWIGGAIGSLFDTQKTAPMGFIATGSDRVQIGNLPAARACVDLANCQMHTQAYPIIKVNASTTIGGITQFPAIVEGSKTVYFEGKPAARKGDKGACEMRIAGGFDKVLIGGPPATCECALLWEAVLEEAKRVIAPGDHDHRARNRLINAAYAQLYLDDKRFRWAGLAGYASKQVGCAMDHAQKVVRGQDSFSPVDVFPDARNVAAESAQYTYNRLGEGNRSLFLDIYPMHLFFKKHGFEKMKECAGERFPPVPPEALEGFEAISGPNPSQEDMNRSLEKLALHEQINILQKEIYNDVLFRRLLDLNEFNVKGVRLPHTKPADVILESGCTDTSGGANTMTFREGERDELYNVEERMDWILKDIGGRYGEFVDTPKHEKDMREIVDQAR